MSKIQTVGAELQRLIKALGGKSPKSYQHNVLVHTIADMAEGGGIGCGKEPLIIQFDPLNYSTDATASEIEAAFLDGRDIYAKGTQGDATAWARMQHYSYNKHYRYGSAFFMVPDVVGKAINFIYTLYTDDPDNNDAYVEIFYYTPAESDE